MSKRHFNDQWIDDKRFSSWIEKCTKQTNAKCCICQKIIDLSTVGVSSLIPHAAGKKHLKAQEGNKVTIKTFMQPQQNSSNSEGSSESSIPIPPRAASTSMTAKTQIQLKLKFYEHWKQLWANHHYSHVSN